MSRGVSPCVYPVWDSLGFLDLGGYFLPHFREFSTIISSSIFSWSFFLSSSGTPMIRMLGHLTLSWRSLRLSSFLLIPFYFFLSVYFYHSIFYLTYPIFCLHYSIFGSLQSVLDLIYCIIHYMLTLFYFF